MAVSPAVPVATDLYLIWAVRTACDVPLAVSLAVAANVAGVLTAESLSAGDTWVSASLHAVFPLVVWRMHRTPQAVAVGLVAVPAAIPATVTATGPHMAAEGFANSFPSVDLWQDFHATEAPDSEAATTPPDAATLREAIAALSAGGRKVTGPMLAAHFGVSARTGRRYLALAAA